MSPTEIDLRNALRDGEGDGPDPDRIVNLGRARRSQRRTRVLSTAAAVVLAAGIATGGAFLARGSSDDASGSSGGFAASKPGDRAAVASAASGASASSAAAGASSSSTGSTGDGAIGAPSAAACPATYPQLMLPGGGGTGQFGAGGKLFAKTPATLTVCAYGADGASGRPASLVLTGADATALADSLENATKTRTYLPCAVSPTPVANRLAVYATATDGTALPVVTTRVQNIQCSIIATNGTAVRYNWHPPADLQQTLLALTPRTDVQMPQDPSPGHISKSPVR